MSTEPDTKAILEAGKSITTAKERHFFSSATCRGIESLAPYALDGTGSPRYLKEAVDLAERNADRDAPLRVGQYTFGNMTSLLAWVERYKTDDTTAFVNAPVEGRDGLILVTIDDLPKSGALGGTKRLGGKLKFELSPELTVWNDGSETWHTPEAFHQFIDQHVDEMANADVLTMISNIEVSSESNWKRTVEPNGTVKLVDEAKAGPKAQVPRRFEFAAPVFSLDDPTNLHRFECALRLKMEGKKPLFQFEIIGLQRTIDQATQKLVEQVGKVCTAYLGAR